MEQNVMLQFELVAGIQSHVFYFSLCIILSFQLKHKNATINKLPRLSCRFWILLDAWNAPFVGTHGSNPENDS